MDFIGMYITSAMENGKDTTIWGSGFRVPQCSVWFRNRFF